MIGNRPEARALCLEDLDHYQQQAIERVSKSLLSALEDLSRIAETKDVGSRDFDPFRSSRLFFVSGEPGGGKTTVYLSLKESLRGRKQSIPEQLDHFKQLVADAHRLVWLEPLDLEPAADTTNFLAAVLVRIEEAAAKLKGRGKPGEVRRPGLLERRPDSDGLDGFQNLRRLQGDVVLAWDGNIAQRAGKLDSDTYGMEVIHVEKARLNVNARLLEALEGVLPEEERGEEALFILPVDDFYLKPDASLALLRLLRMISVPRLFILILGDLDVVEELFYQELLGQLVSLAGGDVFNKVERQEQILTARANALSSHALRKLIPPAQRLRLEVMYELRALDFHPARLDRLQRRNGEKIPLGEEKNLRTLMEDLEFDLSRAALVYSEKAWQPRNFFDFLCLRDPKDEAGSDDYTYSGLAILDLPPREVVDLWFNLDDAVRTLQQQKQKGNTLEEQQKERKGAALESAIRIVLQQTFEALAADTYLSGEDQKRCEDAIQGSPNHIRFLVTTKLDLESQVDPSFPSPIKSSTGAEVQINSHKAWVFRPSGAQRDGKSKEELSKGIGLAPRPSAWLTVLHDLLALSGKDRLLGEPLNPGPASLGWVQIRGGDDSSCVWPLPAWPSIWHLDRFRFAWSQAIRRAHGLRKDRGVPADRLIAWLAFHWIRFATDVLISRHKAPESELQDLDSLKESWKKLVEDLSELSKISESSDFQYRELVITWISDLLTMTQNQIPIDPTISKPIWDLFRERLNAAQAKGSSRENSSEISETGREMSQT